MKSMALAKSMGFLAILLSEPLSLAQMGSIYVQAKLEVIAKPTPDTVGKPWCLNYEYLYKLDKLNYKPCEEASVWDVDLVNGYLKVPQFLAPHLDPDYSFVSFDPSNITPGKPLILFAYGNGLLKRVSSTASPYYQFQLSVLGFDVDTNTRISQILCIAPTLDTAQIGIKDENARLEENGCAVFAPRLIPLGDMNH